MLLTYASLLLRSCPHLLARSGPCAAALPADGSFNSFANTKVALCSVGLMYWGSRGDLTHFEAHDTLRVATIFGTIEVRDALFNCRSGNRPSVPPAGNAYERRFLNSSRSVFQWYDTGQSHIVHNVTIRNCAPWAAGQSIRAWEALSQSDQFTPQNMQATADIRCDGIDIGSAIAMSVTAMQTLSGRMQSWTDTDGTASLRPGRPTLMGSLMAKLWWQLDDACVAVPSWWMWLCDLSPSRTVVNIRWTFDPAAQAAVGTRNCTNFSGKPCTRLGRIMHVGRGNLSTGMETSLNPEITGPANGFGWYGPVMDAGAPRHAEVVVAQANATSDRLVLVLPYPAGAATRSFNISMRIIEACLPGRVCVWPFRSVGSAAEVRNGRGDEYFWDAPRGHLYVRPTMQRGWTIGVNGAWGVEPSLNAAAFQRAGMTIPARTGVGKLVIDADCDTYDAAGAWCATPQAETVLPPSPCAADEIQTGYDRCTKVAPTPTPTPSATSSLTASVTGTATPSSTGSSSANASASSAPAATSAVATRSRSATRSGSASGTPRVAGVRLVRVDATVSVSLGAAAGNGSAGGSSSGSGSGSGWSNALLRWRAAFGGGAAFSDAAQAAYVAGASLCGSMATAVQAAARFPASTVGEPLVQCGGAVARTALSSASTGAAARRMQACELGAASSSFSGVCEVKGFEVTLALSAAVDITAGGDGSDFASALAAALADGSALQRSTMAFLAAAAAVPNVDSDDAAAASLGADLLAVATLGPPTAPLTATLLDGGSAGAGGAPSDGGDASSGTGTATGGIMGGAAAGGLLLGAALAAIAAVVLRRRRAARHRRTVSGKAAASGSPLSSGDCSGSSGRAARQSRVSSLRAGRISVVHSTENPLAAFAPASASASRQAIAARALPSQPRAVFAVTPAQPCGSNAGGSRHVPDDTQ